MAAEIPQNHRLMIKAPTHCAVSGFGVLKLVALIL